MDLVLLDSLDLLAKFFLEVDVSCTIDGFVGWFLVGVFVMVHILRVLRGMLLV